MQQMPDQPHLPQTLDEAAAGPQFTPINLSPLTIQVKPETVQPESVTPDTNTSVITPTDSSTVPEALPAADQQQATLETTLIHADPTPAQTQPSGTTLAGVAVAAGAGLLLWALWQWGRRSATSRREAAFQSRIQIATPTAIPPSTPSPAHQQLIAAADRIARQLEQRAGQLERFIEQADHRIIELKRLSMTPIAPRTQDIATTTIQSQQPAASSQQRATFPRSTREAAKPTSPIAQPSTPITTSRLTTSTLNTVTPNQAATSLSTQHAEVHALADAGLTPVEIAQRLSKPTGQIELILNLRKAAMVA